MAIIRGKKKEPKPKKKGTKPVAPAFATTGMSLKELEIEKTLKSFSYDPIELTYKIMEFGKLLTGVPLYGYQYKIAFRIIYALVTFEGAILTCLLSRQSGKSEGMAFAIDTAAVIFPALAGIFPELEQFKEGMKIGVFAPQSDQVYTTVGRALLRLTSSNAELVMSDPDLEVYLESDIRVELSNGSFCKAQTASKQSKIEGATYDLIIVEEAQDVDDTIAVKSILPMVSATGGTIVKVGTTGTTKNHYWKDIQYNRNQDRKVTDERLFNHWEFDYKKVIKDRRDQYMIDGKMYHLLYEKTVMGIRSRQGEDSMEFKLSYALIWSLETGMLLSEKDWDRICNKRRGFLPPEDGEKVVAGLDIAKDVASTVLTLVKVIPDEDGGPPSKEVLGWLELNNLDYELQHSFIVQALIDYNVQVLVCDYTGVGKPVVDRLMYTCGELVEIVPYEFSRQSKSELWFKFTADISGGRFMIPSNKAVRGTEEWKHCEEQMTNCQKYFDGPYMVCEKLPGFKDDYVDSGALACLAAEYEGADRYEVEQSDYNPLLEKTTFARDTYYRNAL